MENQAFVFFLPFPSVPKSRWDSQFQRLCFFLVLHPISLFLGPTLPGEVCLRELISTIGVPINLSHLPQGLRKSSVTSGPRHLQKQCHLVEQTRQQGTNWIAHILCNQVTETNNRNRDTWKCNDLNRVSFPLRHIFCLGLKSLLSFSNSLPARCS